MVKDAKGFNIGLYWKTLDCKDPLNPLNTNHTNIQGIHESCAFMSASWVQKRELLSNQVDTAVSQGGESCVCVCNQGAYVVTWVAIII